MTKVTYNLLTTGAYLYLQLSVRHCTNEGTGKRCRRGSVLPLMLSVIVITYTAISVLLCAGEIYCDAAKL
jgi:hypothetical protein